MRFQPDYKLSKKLNGHAVLEVIKRYGPVSKREILQRTNLTRPTIDTFINELLGKGFIKESGFSKSTQGRRAKLLSFNSEGGYAVGVDLGIPNLGTVVTNLAAEVVSEQSQEIKEDDRPEKVINVIIKCIEKVIKSSGVPEDKILGIGIVVPGLIDKEKGKSVIIERMKHWEDVPIVKILTSHFSKPVYLEDDANAVALAETQVSNGKTGKDFICISLRKARGLGCGIISDNRLFYGSTGNAGILGHITIDPDGPHCKCGNRGCMETYFSEDTISEKVISLSESEDIPPLLKDKLKKRRIDILTISQLSEEGFNFAKEIQKEIGEVLGIGISNLIQLFDIENVLLGIDLALMNRTFLKIVQGSVDKRLAKMGRKVNLRYAKLKENQGSIGAATLVLEEIFKPPEVTYHFR